MLIVQEYLLTHSLNDLSKDHGVYGRLSKDGHKFSLTYDQIEAKTSSLLVQECRGLILGSNSGKTFSMDSHIGETDVIAFPLRRFFNYGQTEVVFNYDDPNMKILEKLDGTLCILYFDHFLNQWHVATRSVPEADMNVNDTGYSFRSLFEKAVKETKNSTFDEFANSLNKAITYCFELTTPYNQIVISHKTSKITLISARDVSTLKEVMLSQTSVPTSMHVDCLDVPKTMSEVVKFVLSRDAKSFEGVVLVDSNFNRVKVKDPNYCFLSKSKDNLLSSIRNRLEVVLLDKSEDLFAILADDIKNDLISLKEKYKDFLKRHQQEFDVLKEKHKDKKSFAIEISKRKDLWTAPLFQMFDKRVDSIGAFIKDNMSEDGLGYSSSFLDKLYSFL